MNSYPLNLPRSLGISDRSETHRADIPGVAKEQMPRMPGFSRSWKRINVYKTLNHTDSPHQKKKKEQNIQTFILNATVIFRSSEIDCQRDR